MSPWNVWIAESIPTQPTGSMGISHFAMTVRTNDYRLSSTRKATVFRRHLIFSEWRHGDMSELFWMHLGKYVKVPNERSVTLMLMAFRWACHDNQGFYPVPAL